VNSANSAVAHLNILLADDHEVMRLAMRHALQPLAREIRWVEAADAAQVDAVLAGGVDFDLALIDLNMPGPPARRPSPAGGASIRPCRW